MVRKGFQTELRQQDREESAYFPGLALEKTPYNPEPHS